MGMTCVANGAYRPETLRGGRSPDQRHPLSQHQRAHPALTDSATASTKTRVFVGTVRETGVDANLRMPRKKRRKQRRDPLPPEGGP